MNYFHQTSEHSKLPKPDPDASPNIYRASDIMVERIVLLGGDSDANNKDRAWMSSQSLGATLTVGGGLTCPLKSRLKEELALLASDHKGSLPIWGHICPCLHRWSWFLVCWSSLAVPCRGLFQHQLEWRPLQSQVVWFSICWWLLKLRRIL